MYLPHGQKNWTIVTCDNTAKDLLYQNVEYIIRSQSDVFNFITVKYHSVRPVQKSIGKWEIRPPCKIVTPENITLKLCIHDYIGERPTRQILVSIGAVGAFSQ